MSDMPPDRLAVNPKSPYHDAAVLERGVGVRFKGVEKTNVDEYCVSQGWVRLTVGSTLDRRGNAMTVKLSGEVEPYFRDVVSIESDEALPASFETPPAKAAQDGKRGSE